MRGGAGTPNERGFCRELVAAYSVTLRLRDVAGDVLNDERKALKDAEDEHDGEAPHPPAGRVPLVVAGLAPEVRCAAQLCLVLPPPLAPVVRAKSRVRRLQRPRRTQGRGLGLPFPFAPPFGFLLREIGVAETLVGLAVGPPIVRVPGRLQAPPLLPPVPTVVAVEVRPIAPEPPLGHPYLFHEWDDEQCLLAARTDCDERSLLVVPHFHFLNATHVPRRGPLLHEKLILKCVAVRRAVVREKKWWRPMETAHTSTCSRNGRRQPGF